MLLARVLVVFFLSTSWDRKARALEQEEGLQVWDGQMFFRPTEKKIRRSLEERAWTARQIIWGTELEEAKQGRKATSTATGKSKIPLRFIPVRKQEESAWPLRKPHWHFTKTRSKWATKTSIQSPISFFCFYPQRDVKKKRGDLKTWNELRFLHHG